MTGVVAQIYAVMQQRLGRIGKVVVAGGAVRDSLMGREPKDVDIFVLTGTAIEAAMPATAEALVDLDVVEAPDWHKSEPFLQATVSYDDTLVQVMLSPFATNRRTARLVRLERVAVRLRRDIGDPAH